MHPIVVKFLPVKFVFLEIIKEYFSSEFSNILDEITNTFLREVLWGRVHVFSENSFYYEWEFGNARGFIRRFTTARPNR